MLTAFCVACLRRWKRDETGAIVLHPTDKKPVLEFVSIQRTDTGEWATPGGMVDPGEQISATLKREFAEEAMNSLDADDEQQRHKIDKLIADAFNSAAEVRLSVILTSLRLMSVITITLRSNLICEFDRDNSLYYIYAEFFCLVLSTVCVGVSSHSKLPGFAVLLEISFPVHRSIFFRS